MISILFVYSVFAQDFSTLPSGIRDACKRWSAQEKKLELLHGTSAAQGCLDQIDESARECRRDVGPRNTEISRMVVEAGVKGAARAQSQAYASGKRASDNQASQCEEEKEKVKDVCGDLYKNIQEARRSNQKDRASLESRLKYASDPDRARLLSTLQNYKQVDLELGESLNDTRSARELGVQVMDDLISCQIGNARIYGENARQASQVSYAIDSNSKPPEPPDKRSTYDKYGKPVKEWMEDTVTSGAFSTPVSEGIKRWAPGAVGGPAALAVEAGANVLSPTKTSECDELNLDPLKAYDKSCRVKTLRPQSDTQLRHPASEEDDDDQDE